MKIDIAKVAVVPGADCVKLNRGILMRSNLDMPMTLPSKTEECR